MMKMPEEYIVGGHKKQHLITRDSLDMEMNFPLDIKLMETMNLIEATLEYFSYIDEDGIKKSHCYVSSSRGKDSGLNEYLIKKACDKLGIQMIPITLANTLNLYPEEIKFWTTFNRRYGLTKSFKAFLPPKDENGKQMTVFTIREKNGKMEEFRNKSQYVTSLKTGKKIKSTEPDCCNWLKFFSINKWLEEDKEGKQIQCGFDGRRAEENENRSRLIMQHCRSFVTKHKRPRELRVVLPIGMWRKNDVLEFHKQNQIPINPAYEIHGLDRMGCRLCTGYLSWMYDQMRDPSGLRTNDLKMNLHQMERLETERFLNTLKFTIRKLKKNKPLTDRNALAIVSGYAIKYKLIKKSLMKCGIPVFQKGITELTKGNDEK